MLTQVTAHLSPNHKSMGSSSSRSSTVASWTKTDKSTRTLKSIHTDIISAAAESLKTKDKDDPSSEYRQNYRTMLEGARFYVCENRHAQQPGEINLQLFRQLMTGEDEDGSFLLTDEEFDFAMAHAIKIGVFDASWPGVVIYGSEGKA
jgi:hypothetical protein